MVLPSSEERKEQKGTMGSQPIRHQFRTSPDRNSHQFGTHLERRSLTRRVGIWNFGNLHHPQLSFSPHSNLFQPLREGGYPWEGRAPRVPIRTETIERLPFLFGAWNLSGAWNLGFGALATSSNCWKIPLFAPIPTLAGGAVYTPDQPKTRNNSARYWSLEFGISLELGIWNLELCGIHRPRAPNPCLNFPRPILCFPW